jgi:hypothetical protein
VVLSYGYQEYTVSDMLEEGGVFEVKLLSEPRLGAPMLAVPD